MDIIIIIAAIILLLSGLIGCVLPVVPGPPISFLGLFVAHFSDNIQFSFEGLLIYGGIAVLVTILDFFVPVWGTKKFGGTRAGLWGSTFGLIAGLFILPWLGIAFGPFGLFGIILAPFVGAFIGEMIAGKKQHDSFRAALGSFIGFLTGTFMKLLVSGYFIAVFIKKLF